MKYILVARSYRGLAADIKSLIIRAPFTMETSPKVPILTIFGILSCSFIAQAFNLPSGKKFLWELIFANFFFGHFEGINFRAFGFTEDSAGINFRELSLTKHFAGINFRESALFKDFAGVNSTTLVHRFENNLSKN